MSHIGQSQQLLLLHFFKHFDTLVRSVKKDGEVK